jgi:hypothetical protein
MSAITPKVDIDRGHWNVRFGPIADIGRHLVDVCFVPIADIKAYAVDGMATVPKQIFGSQTKGALSSRIIVPRSASKKC